MKTANIIEIFSSIQGEGPYIGCRQIFIRFAGCNLSCNYCDTAFNEQNICNVYTKSLEKIPNPVSTEELLHIIKKLNKVRHHSISFTGGEPLMHAGFLTEFLPEFKQLFPNTKTYLETNGTLFEELNKIIDNIDIISMDLKLESSTKNKIPIAQHRKFIDIAQKFQKEIYLKAVISNEICHKEITELCSLINSLEKKPMLVLQPVDSKNKDVLISAEKLLQVQERFLEQLEDVRVIPQVHKFLNLL